MVRNFYAVVLVRGLSDGLARGFEASVYPRGSGGKCNGGAIDYYAGCVGKENYDLI